MKRASTPKQKEERRKAVIQAAIDVLEREGPAQAGLSAIAREAGLSKGNLYRYFESREAIFLQVLLDDYEIWVGRVAEGLKDAEGSDDATAVTRVMACALAECPRLVTLAPLVSSMLEHNVPAEVIVRFKSSMSEVSARVSRQLQLALPSLTLDSVDRLMAAFHCLVNGMGPSANPPEAVQDALKSPELVGVSVDFETEIAELLTTIVFGLRSRFGVM